ncbi:hypothetical protein AB3R30_15320 [Leptolyngbyaceae cyanobacterium UHCC 1019]
MARLSSLFVERVKVLKFQGLATSTTSTCRGLPSRAFCRLESPILGLNQELALHHGLV